MRRVLAEQRRSAGEVLRWIAALPTAAAAAIHFAVTPEHFREDWSFGTFFAAAALSQLVWALLAVRFGHRWLMVAGVVGNLAIALVWAASRTTGLPAGPDPGAREAAEFIDVLATAFEFLAATALVLALRFGTRLLDSRAAAAILIVLALVVIPLTAAAIATRGDHADAPQDRGRMNALQTNG